MKAIAGWFARNPVAANLLMVLLIVGGGLSAATIQMELFPEFSLDTISVRVAYPGAAPEEVEEGILVPIEEETHGLEGVDEITSIASEGLGTVLVEVRRGEDPRRVLDDVETRVDAIETFPEEAEEPVIEELLLRHQVINLAVFGDADERTLKRVAEEVRDDLNALEGVSQVELSATRPYEVSIEVSEEALRRYGLSFDEVARAVRSFSLDLSGGSMKTEGGEILLRTMGQAREGREFEALVLRTRPDGARILLGDVATVVDAFADVDRFARFNGQPVALVQLFRVGDESALEISEAVHRYVRRKQPTLPAGVQLEPWQDNARMLESRLDLLVRNGLQGLALVFLVLALLLRFRLAFWVALGIPLSFLGAFLLLPALDQSINMLSLFAFILVLGIVVDDAIIVGENVYEENRLGRAGVEGAVRGVHGVAIPVFFAVFTTIVAFLPMVALPGVMGKFFAVIPLAVIPALLFSLVESQWILPAHLAHGSRRLDALSKRPPFRWWVRMQEAVSGGLNRFVERVYEPFLERALVHRALTVAVAVALLLLALAVVGGGFVQFVFFPDVEGDVVAAQVTLPEGTSTRATARAVERMEEAAARLAAELEEEGDPVVANFMATVGEQPYLAQQQMADSAGGVSGPHYGEVVLELVPSEERDVQSSDVARRWRELVGEIPGAVELSFNAALMSAGDPIHVRLAGSDVAALRAAAEELQGRLATYPGVFDARHSLRGGKDELVLDVLPAAETLGLSRLDLARQVRQGFYGEEAQRIQRGRDEVKVMVRYPEAARETLAQLEHMRLRTASGAQVPLASVASIEPREGYATIRRADRFRTADVTAEIDLAVANPNDVLAALREDVLPDLAGRFGLSWSFEGQKSEQSDVVGSMSRWFVLALVGIYALMAIPFRSYLQPLIVMLAIPFGMIGAVAGHLIMGMDLSMLSVLGLVALAGVVVNDSIVLVDYVNQRRRDAGEDELAAAKSAGARRFRPILLTSLTTFAGLLPLLLERSVQAQFLVPMAVSLGFGVLFSTAITLVLVPATYLILEDLRGALQWLYGERPEAARSTRPAGA